LEGGCLILYVSHSVRIALHVLLKKNQYKKKEELSKRMQRLIKRRIGTVSIDLGKIGMNTKESGMK